MPDHDLKVVTHVGHIPEDVSVDKIHLHRLERDLFRARLKWLAIVVALSLLAAGLVLLLSDFSTDFQTYGPGYEPKDLQRQQQMEQVDRARQP